MNDNQIEFFKIILAGKKIEIECNYRPVFYQCRDYLAKFDCPDFVIRTSIEEIIAERKHAPEIQNHLDGIAVRYADEFAEPNIVYRKIAHAMLNYDTLLFHGSVVATDNLGYMFAARSGVGKSTRTKLWVDSYPGSFVVNGDKPLISVTETQVLAHGTPWCGEEGWNVNTTVPLRAIFLLERAKKGEATSITEISLRDAFPILIQQTNCPTDAEDMKKSIQLLKAFEGRVKIYRFISTPTAEAIRLAYETARPR